MHSNPTPVSTIKNLYAFFIIVFCGSFPLQGQTQENPQTTNQPENFVFLSSIEPQNVQVAVDNRPGVAFSRNGTNPKRPGAALLFRGEAGNQSIFMAPGRSSVAFVTYSLDQAYEKLIGAIAIPVLQGVPQTDPHTPLVFKVLGDGELLWESEKIGQKDALKPFEVLLQGVSSLKLEVHCPGSDWWALAAWYEPKLIRQNSPQESDPIWPSQPNRPLWADIESPKVTALMTEFDQTIQAQRSASIQQIQEIEKGFQMREELIRARLISSLTEVMEQETKKVNLEEANRIKRYIEQLREAKTNFTPPPAKPNATSKPSDPKSSNRVKTRIPKTAAGFGNHHYAWVPQKLTWHMASQFAASQGGYLARVESADEMGFILQLCNGKEGVWLDGSDAAEEGTWRFSNGELADWSLFKMDSKFSRLRNVNGCNQILYFRDGLIDEYGSLRHSFIIEWDK